MTLDYKERAVSNRVSLEPTISLNASIVLVKSRIRSISLWEGSTGRKITTFQIFTRTSSYETKYVQCDHDHVSNKTQNKSKRYRGLWKRHFSLLEIAPGDSFLPSVSGQTNRILSNQLSAISDIICCRNEIDSRVGVSSELQVTTDIKPRWALYCEMKDNDPYLRLGSLWYRTAPNGKHYVQRGRPLRHTFPIRDKDHGIQLS
jgi:hypothetical protein